MPNEKDWMTSAEKLALFDAINEGSDDEKISFVVFYKDFVEQGNRGALLDALYHRCISDE